MGKQESSVKPGEKKKMMMMNILKIRTRCSSNGKLLRCISCEVQNQISQKQGRE